MAAGQLTGMDPHHLIFAIWAATQHYADFDVQVSAILGESAGKTATAGDTLLTLFIHGLRPR